MFEKSPHEQSPRPTEKAEERISDINDAREYVAELLVQGERPIITIPKEYISDIEKYGITSVPKHDLLTGKKFSFVAGVIGLDPYLPENEERHVYEVDPGQVRIEPRLTGSDTSFHGVVGFPDGIPASALTPLGWHSAGSWSAHKDIEKGPVQ